MMLTKVKVNTSLSWCSCCGKQAEPGEDLVKIEVAGTARYIKLTHLVSWSSLSGPGEKLELNNKAKPKPRASTGEGVGGNFEAPAGVKP